MKILVSMEVPDDFGKYDLKHVGLRCIFYDMRIPSVPTQLFSLVTNSIKSHIIVPKFRGAKKVRLKLKKK